jgi:hypothetical protein
MPSQWLTRGSAPLPRPRRFQAGTRELRRRRLHLAAWRQALGQKSLYLLLILVFFLMFTPYSVVLFLDEGDRWLTRDLARNPEAVRVILYLIICKLVGFGVLFVSLPAVGNWFLDEEAAPPRPPDKVVARAWPLTASQRLLLAEGALVRGVVEAVRWPQVTVSYEDAQGSRHEARLRAHESPSIQAPEPGEVMSLLYDPSRPGEVVAPSLLEVTFLEGAPLEDRRAEALPAAPAPEAPSGEVACALLASLRPVRSPWWPRGRQERRAQAGALRLSAQGELWVQEGRQAPRSLRLDEPFVLHLGAWLLPEGRAELHVWVRRKDAPPREAPIQLRAELPQASLSRSLPILQSNAPLVPPEDFARLWVALRHYAAAWGDDPGPLVQPAHAAVTAPPPAGVSTPATPSTSGGGRRGR